MSVLKKIGLVLLKVGSIASELLGFPFVAQLLGQTGKTGTVVNTVLSDFGTMAQAVSMAEVAFPSIAGAKTGSQKLEAAAPLIQQQILLWAQSNLPGHNKLLVTPQQFADHCKLLTSDFADILNDFGE